MESEPICFRCGATLNVESNTLHQCVPFACGKVIDLSEHPEIEEALQKSAEETAEFAERERYRNQQAWNRIKNLPLD